MTETMTVSEAAEMTGYSEGHVRWLIRHGRVDASKVGQRVYLVDRGSLEGYVKAMEAKDKRSHGPQGSQRE